MGELERLGDSAPFGWLLLELLELDHWHVHVRAALGDGVIVIGHHPDLPRLEIVEAADTVAHAAPPFFARCVEARRDARRCHLTPIPDPE